MFENGLDLEQVYKDQDPNLFIEKGNKILYRHRSTFRRRYRKVG